jgi:ankyrin repeat protein
VAAVEVLLRAGADVEAKTGGGQTAVDVARERGHQGVVQVIEQWRSGKKTK